MADPEAEKSITIAEKAMREGNIEKAKRFLLKSLKIQATERAKTLLVQCDNMEERKNGERKMSEDKTKQTRNESQEEVKEETKRSYSDEDSKLCEEFLKKTNYYEILGVEKNATEEEIKRKYKKIALKLHPDKNHSPKATEAFKKVSQAFACLSDKNKRKIYDEHGTEENFRQQYHEYFADEDEFDPEDIFEMFFTGRVNPNRRRRVYRRAGNTYYYTTNNQGQNQNPRARYASLLQLLPFLLIVLFAFFFQMKGFGDYGGGYSGYSNLYSLEPSFYFRIPKVTKLAQVKYFVQDGFDYQYKNNKQTLARIEEEVIKDYFQLMERRCRKVVNAKQYLERQIRYLKADSQERLRYERDLKRLDYTSCNEYQRINRMF